MAFCQKNSTHVTCLRKRAILHVCSFLFFFPPHYTHTHTHIYIYKYIYIYIYIYVCVSELASHDQKGLEGLLFNSYYTEVLGSALLFPWVVPPIIDQYLMMLNIKQRGIKYHFWVFVMTRPAIEPRSLGHVDSKIKTGSLKYCLYNTTEWIFSISTKIKKRFFLLCRFSFQTSWIFLMLSKDF